MPSVPVATRKEDAPQFGKPAVLDGYMFWQPNCHNQVWVLAIDLDRDDALMHFFSVMTHHEIPPPSWIIEKSSNRHVQAAWIIERVPTGPNSRIKPQNFARLVRTALTNVFGADPNFTNARMWNPFWTGWEAENVGTVDWIDPTPYKLNELREPMMRTDGWNPYRPKEDSPSTTAGPVAVGHYTVTGRNVWVFNQARLRTHGSVAEAADLANWSLPNPLPPAEVNTIVRSISRYEAIHGKRSGNGTMTEEQRAVQRERGAKGGSRNTEAQKQARDAARDIANTMRTVRGVGRAAEVQMLHEQGLTRRQIMARLDVSESTVKRALRAAREQADDNA